MKNNMVTKSNDIVEASYRLTLNEQRILLSCISMIDSREALNENKEFRLDVKSFAETFDLDLKVAYSQVKEGADKFSERSFKVRENKGSYDRINWTSKVKYYDDEGSIGIHFGVHAIPYLASIQKNFTSYRLSNISKLTSIYAIRLYEMLLQWKKIQKITFDLKNFREALGIQNNEYKRMFDFKRKVLNIAIKQINEHTNINCIVKEIKKGRSIVALEFRFGEDCPTQLELEQAIAEAPFMH